MSTRLYKAAALLLLAPVVLSATVEITNRTGLEIYFVWVCEAHVDKWVDVLGLDILDEGETLEFYVDQGYYNIRIEDSNWETYTVLDIPLGHDDVFVWNVSLCDKDR